MDSTPQRNEARPCENTDTKRTLEIHHASNINSITKPQSDNLEKPTSSCSSDSPSARPPTSALTRDVPGSPDEPLAAADVVCLHPQASNSNSVCRNSTSRFPTPNIESTNSFKRNATISTTNSTSSRIREDLITRTPCSDVWRGQEVTKGSAKIASESSIARHPRNDITVTENASYSSLGLPKLPVEALSNSEIYDSFRNINCRPSTSTQFAMIRQPNHQSTQEPSITKASCGSRSVRNKILVLQWNIRSIWANYAEFSDLVLSNPPITLCLQELMAENVENCLKERYSWKLAHRAVHNGKGSAGLGNSKEVPHRFIDTQQEIPICAARLLNPYNLTVVSMYFPHTAKEHDIIDALNNFLQISEPPYIFAGDVNASHEAWGSSKSTKRGRMLLSWVVKNQMIVLNDGSPTCINEARGSLSAIDITIASHNLASKVTWEVAEDSMGSDHIPITLNTNMSLANYEYPKRWLYKDANWKEFERKFEQSMLTGSNMTVETLDRSILEAAMSTIPRTSGKPYGRSAFWWTNEVKQVVKARRKALRALKRKDPEDPQRKSALQEFQRKRSEARKAIAKAKQDSWDQFCENFGPTTGSDQIWKNFNRLCGKKVSGNKSFIINHEHVTNPVRIAEHFADIFEENTADITNSQSDGPAILAESIFDDDGSETSVKCTLDSNFTLSELLSAIDSAKGHSTGMDQIGYPMIKRLPPSGKLAMLDSFNKVWTEGRFPDSWKEGIVVPIPKHGEKRQLATSYRPITLLSCIGKIYERMVNHRLITFLEQNSLLHPDQHAFRAGRGTSTYFAELNEILSQAIIKHHHCELAMLDLRKAYDRTWRPYILHRVKELKMGTNMYKCIEGFLTDRKFQVRFGGETSKPRAQKTGVPQGSVLSVTLFILVMDTIFEAVPKGVRVLLYADDILLIATGKQAFAARVRLKKSIEAVDVWAKRIRFEFSASKSMLLHVCQRKHSNLKKSRFEIKINGERIPDVPSARILGVVLDRRCTYQKHFRIVRESVQKRINFIRAIAKHASRGILWRIGNAICLSKLLYGIELFGIKCVKPYQPIFNQLLRATSGAFRTSSSMAMAVESGILPLNERVILAMVKSLCRIEEKSITNRPALRHATNSAFMSLTGFVIPSVQKLHRLGRRPWNVRIPSIDWTVKNEFKVGQGAVKAKAIMTSILNEKYAKFEEIYTDGSKCDSEVGFGIINSGPPIERKLPSQFSIFSTEAAAIATAVKIASKRPTIIFSDSASCLKALESGKCRNACIQAIESNIRNKNVTFCWIPGHTGIVGNENADQAANRGRASRMAMQDVPGCDIAKWAATEIWKNHQNNWSNEHHQLASIKAYVGKWTDRPKRKEQIALTRCRLGHTRITKSHIFKKLTADICEICNVELNVDHILTKCQKFDDIREKLGISINLREALSNNKKSEIKILKYLQLTKLLQEL